MITFTCPHCQKSIKAEDKYAGATKKCPGCGEQFTVPVTPPPLPVETPVQPIQVNIEQPQAPPQTPQQPVQQTVLVQAPPSNALGLAGFITSLVGFLTCGLLSPIAVLLSFFALFKSPRGFAVAGTVLGLLGSSWMALFGFAFLAALVFPAVDAARNAADTMRAQQAITDYYDVNKELPDQAIGNEFIADLNCQYEPIDEYSYKIIHAGADEQFGTSDDYEHTERVR